MGTWGWGKKKNIVDPSLVVFFFMPVDDTLSFFLDKKDVKNKEMKKLALATKLLRTVSHTRQKHYEALVH